MIHACRVQYKQMQQMFGKGKGEYNAQTIAVAQTTVKGAFINYNKFEQ